MVFSSAVFLFVFLPVFLGVYYVVPFKYRSYVILAGSLFFYGWWRIDFMFLMMAVVLWSHLIAKAMVRHVGQPAGRRWLTLGIVLNLATLGVFKYFNFGIDSLNMVIEQSGLNSIEAIKIILPIGISFYIFQAISFLIDVYRGDAPPARRLIDFAAFITLFPQLIAGPILRYKDLADQFEERTHSMDKFSEGAKRFMWGFAKKVLIADTVAPLADAAFALEDPSMADAWLGALAYTVQLYFDFSGYSDMAIGIGLMLGFRFIENFNKPYISASITEFWRRWHISLSTWLRDYLYIPLGGNRGGEAKTYRNLVLTMVLGGAWHGANWTFVIWGFWHGAIMAIERALGVSAKRAANAPAVTAQPATLEEPRPEPPPRHAGPFNPLTALKILFTFFLVVLGWVMFRAEDVGAALQMYEGMFAFNSIAISDAYEWQIKSVPLCALFLGMVIVFIVPWIQTRMQTAESPKKCAAPHITVAANVGLGLLFLLAVSRLLALNYSPFLYFQF